MNVNLSSFFYEDSCHVKKGKGKFFLEQAMKAQRRSRGIAVLFLEPQH
jgi:hypothetical protein